jgi:hypothetical protein
VTPAEERWAEALAIERLHGADAAAFVARRMTELALSGDLAGVARMEQIADHIDLLQRPCLVRQ